MVSSMHLFLDDNELVNAARFLTNVPGSLLHYNDCRNNLHELLLHNPSMAL